MAKIQNTNNTKCWWECGAIGTLIHYWLGMQNGTATLEDCQFVIKLNILLPYDPGIIPLGICPKELKTYVHKYVYSSFNYNCPNVEATKTSFSRSMDKQWYIQTMEYYSALKRNKLSSPEKTQRKLKCILLSERSQSEKAACFMILTIWHSEKGKTMKTVKKISGCQGWVERERWIGRVWRIFRAVKILYVIP